MSFNTSMLLKAPSTIPQLYAKALWDPTPTRGNEIKEKQLAYALGYPLGWHVEREVVVQQELGGENNDGEKEGQGHVRNKKRCVIKDRIHAYVKSSKKSAQLKKLTWLHHDAAQLAAQLYRQQEEAGETPTNMESHLLPPIPLYQKGDEIQVEYEDGKFYEGVILKRKKTASDEFVYQIHYTDDDTLEDSVPEQQIQPRDDPHQLALQLGFPSNWKAVRRGARYHFICPTTKQIYKTKKAALQSIKEQQQQQVSQVVQEEEEGDPPWRLTGHEWIGRYINYVTTHRVSATREIRIEQKGLIEGYIDAKDLDKEGNPGFISETTNEPAHLFHVTFQDDPHHPYASHLLASQDLEEYEIRECLLPLE